MFWMESWLELHECWSVSGCVLCVGFVFWCCWRMLFIVKWVFSAVDVWCYIILITIIIYYTYIYYYYILYYLLLISSPLFSPLPSSPPTPSSSSTPTPIHSIRVGVYCSILISPRCLCSSVPPSQYLPNPRIFWPRMFYRSGWLRCDVFKDTYT